VHKKKKKNFQRKFDLDSRQQSNKTTRLKKKCLEIGPNFLLKNVEILFMTTQATLLFCF
jgi:hypothetical protein